MRIVRGFRGMAETGSRTNLHLTTALSLLILVSTAAARYSGGTGEPNDPYQIATAADLMVLGETPADYDKHFILTADIDLDPNLPGGRVFSDAVVASLHRSGMRFGPPFFMGFFDGRRHTISHLTMAEGGALGLFGGVGSGAVLINLRLEAVDIRGVGAGSLVSRNEGSIANCCSTGAIDSSTDAGGLVRDNHGDIRASHSTVTVTGTSKVGGLVGDNTGRIVNSYAGGRVSGDSFVGGLVGSNGHIQRRDVYYEAPGEIINSYSTGIVSAAFDVGGLVGFHEIGPVISSFWDIQTSGQTASAAGTGRTTAEMQIARTFLDAGWDFVGETANGIDDIWWIDEGRDYPRLWWEPRSPGRLPVIELDGTTFDAQIAHGIVLVDFFATWCSHCATQAPILEDVADRLEGRAQVAKLDVDKSRGIVLRYGVTAVPTLILFREGVEVTRFVGVTSADVLVAAILAAGSSE